MQDVEDLSDPAHDMLHIPSTTSIIVERPIILQRKTS
jgi:hypothetical protein